MGVVAVHFVLQSHHVSSCVAIFLYKETYTRRGVVAEHFLLQSQEVQVEFMYKAMILGDKLLLSNMTDREAT